MTTIELKHNDHAERGGSAVRLPVFLVSSCNAMTTIELRREAKHGVQRCCHAAMLARRPRRGGVAWVAQRGDAGSRCVIDDADRWMDERRGEG